MAHGTPGHASIPRPDNPQDRLVQALTRVRWWSQPARLTEPVAEMLQTLASSQSFPRSFLFANADKTLVWSILRHSLEKNPLFAPLLCNTISLTVLRGGQTSNVIPAHAEAKLDVRLLPGENPELFLAALRSIIADPKVAVEVEEFPVIWRNDPHSRVSVLADPLNMLADVARVRWRFRRGEYDPTRGDA